MLLRINYIIFSITVFIFSNNSAYAERWILIDTTAHNLSVFNGDTLERFYPRVALGRRGSGNARQRGGNVTPTGEFRVAWINHASNFNIFFGLNFPNVEHTERAYQRHLIDIDTYYALRTALLEGRTPPQNTPLGGNIGIHGLGLGDLSIHRKFDWTQGCVALTNTEIEQLAQWVEVGTLVIIH